MYLIRCQNKSCFLFGTLCQYKHLYNVSHCKHLSWQNKVDFATAVPAILNKHVYFSIRMIIFWILLYAELNTSGCHFLGASLSWKYLFPLSEKHKRIICILPFSKSIITPYSSTHNTKYFHTPLLLLFLSVSKGGAIEVSHVTSCGQLMNSWTWYSHRLLGENVYSPTDYRSSGALLAVIG